MTVCRNGHEQSVTLMRSSDGWRPYCSRCFIPLDIPPTREMDAAETVIIAVILVAALAGFGWWFWDTWLA